MNEIPNAAASFLKEEDVSAILRISVGCLRRWRLFGRGPKFLKIGGSVRYRAADFEQWLASRPAGGEFSPEGRR